MRTFVIEEKHVQRRSDIFEGQHFFFFFTWSSSCVKDSIENEVKDITKTQIKKGLGGI